MAVSVRTAWRVDPQRETAAPLAVVQADSVRSALRLKAPADPELTGRAPIEMTVLPLKVIDDNAREDSGNIGAMALPPKAIAARARPDHASTVMMVHRVKATVAHQLPVRVSSATMDHRPKVRAGLEPAGNDASVTKVLR